jgi:hypothetical protein
MLATNLVTSLTSPPGSNRNRTTSPVSVEANSGCRYQHGRNAAATPAPFDQRGAQASYRLSLDTFTVSAVSHRPPKVPRRW